MKKSPLFNFVLFIFIFSLSACGGGSGTDSVSGHDTGSIAFRLKWESPPATYSKTSIMRGDEVPEGISLAPSGDICVDYGISTVAASATNTSNYTAANWPCSDHYGLIAGVSAGSNYTVKIEGKDSSNTVTWRGEQTGITVNAGQEASTVTVTMTYIGSDTTPPTVSSVTPSNNATRVSIASQITVTFSENMASSTISTSTFTLKEGTTSINGTITYDSSTKTATFTPSSNLSTSTAYTAEVTTGVTDMAGNAMIGSYSWSFTTESVPDITAPANSTSSNFINGGATSTNSTLVSLSISATDSVGTDIVGVTGYYASETSTTPSASASGWTAITSATSYSASVPFTLSSGNGTKTVYVWFKDTAGNISASASDSIVLDNTAPTDGTLSAATGTQQISLSWSGFSDSSGIASYKLVYSTASSPSSCSAGTQIYSGTSTSYTHTGLTNGTTYYYLVCATDNVENTSAGATVSSIVWWKMLKLPDTGQTTSYTTTFGEDHDYTINPPSYTDNGAGTITDNVTGLIWQKEDDNTTRTWVDAGTYCDNLSLGGSTDWRLPSKKELISIVDYGRFPAINSTYFPNTKSGGVNNYWSSTTNARSTSGALIVKFQGGEVNYDYKSNSYYVRCVRGG